MTHAPRLRKHCILSDPLTLPRGRLTGVKLGRKFPGSMNLKACIVYTAIAADIFTHCILEKYLGATRRPRYNGVRVI